MQHIRGTVNGVNISQSIYCDICDCYFEYLTKCEHIDKEINHGPHESLGNDLEE